LIYRIHIPAWPLSELVQQLWYCGGYRAPHARERVLPDGAVQIIIRLGSARSSAERLPQSVIVGVRAEYEVIDTAELAGAIMGVHFRAGGARPFLRVPASELNGSVVPLESLWGNSAAELRDRLLVAASPESKFQVLEEWLLQRAGGGLARHPAVTFAVREFSMAPGERTIAAVSGQAGFSARRFIQIFREEVGLTPKLYCRIRRFRRVLGRIGSGGEVRWTDIALACGYYDQAHFIHDFHAFSGINPSQYLARRGAWASHVIDSWGAK
jgi:AraC-like DNA-binding protein